MLEVLHVRALVPRLKESEKSEIVLNHLTPGLCHLELGRERGTFFKWFKFFFIRTTEMGSRSLIHTAQGCKETNGQFLWSCNVAK